MDIFVILKNQKLKLEDIKDLEELDYLITQLKNISDEDIKKSINKENIGKIQHLIDEILNRVEQLKKETVQEIQFSQKKATGIKAYLKNG